MTQEQIENKLAKNPGNPFFEIHFKARNPVNGLFITTRDTGELSFKNLWRIVSESALDEFKKTGNENLSRIFNGTDFTRMDILPIKNK